MMGRGGHVPVRGGLLNGSLSARSRAGLERRMRNNVARDRALYIERRTASPARRAEIDSQRATLAREQIALEYGTRRAGQLRSTLNG